MSHVLLSQTNSLLNETEIGFSEKRISTLTLSKNPSKGATQWDLNPCILNGRHQLERRDVLTLLLSLVLHQGAGAGHHTTLV